MTTQTSVSKKTIITDDETSIKILYNGVPKFIINESSGGITIGSVDGTGAGAIFSSISYTLGLNVGGFSSGASVMNVNGESTFTGGSLIVSGQKLQAGEIYQPSHGTETTKPTAGDAIQYIKSGKMVWRYNNAGSNAYFWFDMTSTDSTQFIKYSTTEPS